MLVETARAKINLYLHIVGRRDDGYHLLDSLVAFAAIGDTLYGAPADAPSLRVDGPFAAELAGEELESNSVARAARATAAALGCPAAIAFRLVKTLPVAAGLGGGSADAAAALRICARAWSIAEDDPRLAAIARGLGADVPACLAGRPAFMGGIGDELASAPKLPRLSVVLVNPGVALPTTRVFAGFRGQFSDAARFSQNPHDARELAEILAARRNDLLDPAMRCVAQIRDVLDALAASPGCFLARMSGSGATCFGLYADDAAAGRAASWLTANARGWWIAPSTIAA